MSDYTISRIFLQDRRAVRQLDQLLKQEGIERDRNLDYTAGLYDSDYNLIATGSCFQNTLRCLAVDHRHQGEGLMNQIITHLTDYQYSRGILSLFLYTKCEAAHFFSDLGFYEITRVQNKLVFMENRKHGFDHYLEQLIQETTLQTAHFSETDGPIGAVIINANPFTLGHQYLLEQATAQCRQLHVFMVSEDVSLIPFSVRERLIRSGSAHLGHVIYHTTGHYLISNATFPSYFLKDQDTVIRSHARLDVALFEKIAVALGITCRFAGEEPFSQVTSIYNQVMTDELGHAGIRCIILPRKKQHGTAISASMARQALKNGDLETFHSLVPDSTYAYFLSNEAKPVLETIRQCEDVIHY